MVQSLPVAASVSRLVVLSRPQPPVLVVSAEAVEEEEAHTKSKAKRGAVREYCDNCEMFGHSNENCDAGETY